MRFTILFCLFLLSLTIGCHSAKEFPKAYKGEKIQFGQGGGFSGAVTEFLLPDDGRLFQMPWRDTTQEFISQWDKKFTKQIFHNYHALNLGDLSHNEPGDLYYYINYQADMKSSHRIVWGKPGFRPEENLVTFYNVLFKSSKLKS